MRAAGWVFVSVLSVGFCAGAVDDPWADAVVDYQPGPNALLKDPSKALGAPRGIGPATPDNSAVVSLGGPGGSITLRFNTPVTDDPDNPLGLDCIVYSNAFWTGGNPQVRFQEPALIEISEDINGNGLPDDPWYLVPGSRAFAYQPFPYVVEPDGQGNSPEEPYWLAGSIRNPNSLDADPANDSEEYNWGYAELSPTMAPFLDNYVRPDDPFVVGHTPRSGGGDAFDIAWAVDAEGNPAPITQFHFVRLTAFVSRNFGALGHASPEINAVADVAPDIDTDGDGILDEYEVRVAGTDPARRESTILPLEIPAIEGGSPSGALLGVAEDARGSKLRLYAAGQRTAEGRAHSVRVDILAPAEPGGALPDGGLVKSGVVREFVSSEADFVAAGIQEAELVIQYKSGEIAGLDEAGIEPFRYAAGAYTREGISQVQVNAAANRVTFQTQFPGLFILASGPGAGDAGSGEGPQGPISLEADPPTETVADPANTVAVSSGVIRDGSGQPVADGTLVTVASTRGEIATPDAEPGTPGVQAAAVAGLVSFSLRAAAQAGPVLITATSVEGGAYGELAYAFAPGPAAPGVLWTVGEPETNGTVVIALVSSVIGDRFGNPVRDGTLVTVEVEGAAISTGDADLVAPGFQALVAGGVASVTVETAAKDAPFTIATYRDPECTVLLGFEELSGADYTPTPAVSPCGLAALAGSLLAGLLLRRRAPRC